MAITPIKQPVAADKNYVDVYYVNPVNPWMSELICSSCAVKRVGNFAMTTLVIMREGIFVRKEENGPDIFYIPPSAIIKIKNRL